MAKTKKQTVDVINYFLTPKARVLSDEEKEKVLLKYNASEDKFPIIYSSDPLAAALGLKPGQLVELERDDGTGLYKYYRICVEEA